MFSQFTKFLDAIEPHLKKAGISCVRFDGSMTAKRRAEVIERFQAQDSPDDDDEEEEEDGEKVVDVSDSATEDSEDEIKPVVNKGKRAKKSTTPSIAQGKGKGKQRRLPGVKGPRVMLISLKSGSVGINLTAAQVGSLHPHLPLRTIQAD